MSEINNEEMEDKRLEQEIREIIIQLHEKSKYIMTNSQDIVIGANPKVDNDKQAISNLNDVLDSIGYFINDFKGNGKGITVYNIGMLKSSKLYIKAVREYIHRNLER